jgi:hypothetical protein
MLKEEEQKRDTGRRNEMEDRDKTKWRKKTERI